MGDLLHRADLAEVQAPGPIRRSVASSASQRVSQNVQRGRFRREFPYAGDGTTMGRSGSPPACDTDREADLDKRDVAGVLHRART